jgi:bile acid-coenzyme A ligase
MGEQQRSGASFGHRLTMGSTAHPDEVAITFLQQDGGVREVTWAEAEASANRIARGLLSKGIGSGDRVAVEIRNSPEHVFAVFGAWKVGATVVPMRWDLPDWERERVLEAMAPAFVFRGPEAVHQAPFVDQPTTPPPDVTPPFASAICSSGSTGVPKVILRLSPGWYEQGEATVKSFVNPLNADSKSRMIVSAPMYHNNGYLAPLELVAGRPFVLLERFTPDLLLDAVEHHGGTGFVAATTMLQRLARYERTAGVDFSDVDWIMQGASPIADWLVEYWIDRVGADHLLLTYGSSELIGTTICTGAEWLEHRGTSGKPRGELEVRILDEDGKILPPGEVGLIYMKNPAGFGHQYLGAETKPAELVDGFVSLGDLGYLDEDGYLFFEDRRVDMIVTGGANVYPAEVEAALSEHPRIADVIVIGLPDPEWGRRVHAIVQLAPDDAGTGAPSLTPDEVISWAKERLAGYKVPKTVEFIDQIPRTEATKINRSALVDQRAAGA